MKLLIKKHCAASGFGSLILLLSLSWRPPSTGLECLVVCLAQSIQLGGAEEQAGPDKEVERMSPAFEELLIVK